jgi:hypothetical protein
MHLINVASRLQASFRFTVVTSIERVMVDQAEPLILRAISLPYLQALRDPASLEWTDKLHCLVQ